MSIKKETESWCPAAPPPALTVCDHVSVQGHKWGCVCLCFPKRRDPQGTPARYPAPQRNPLSTSPFSSQNPQLQKTQKTNLVCIYNWLCVYVFYVNSLLWNTNTQQPAIFQHLVPFLYHSMLSIFFPHKPCAILPHWVTFLIPLGCISLPGMGERQSATFRKQLEASGPASPSGPSPLLPAAPAQ